MPPQLIVGTTAEVASAFAQLVRDDVDAAIAGRGRCTCALTGGSVARAWLPVLAGLALDWQRIDWFWGDERAVPPDDPESNFGLARELLLDRIEVTSSHIHRMPADGRDLDAAARAYEKELVSVLGPAPVLDVVLLGVGADGHICSLFPGHPATHEHTRLVVPVADAPKPPPRRLTLTFPVLEAAQHVYVAAFGAEKRAVIQESLEAPAPTNRLPLARILARQSGITLFLDEAVAGSANRRRQR